ncbi:hypothetical protein TRFO_12449 [Tritrichomonas foetus]|uniref:UBX domain-containing protein n=1 Tax=Tritrichomonas foetus TaxID=1144522 RepID=A0A1J4L1B7_9EUKA|nr:hypothetical protein TRFO_12449 [Tritrichomonas foetus]|eukprot:OHT17311.1 hypothetical protein TRFO_12449 [Tritrichomonas foetus]
MFPLINGHNSNFLPHFLSMSSRNSYENLFLQHGISRHQLCMMPEIEFQKILQFILSHPNETLNNYNNPCDTQYRYISAKHAAEQEKKMRNSRREPLIASSSGIDPAYQPRQQTQYQPNEGYQDYSQYQQMDEETALQMAMMESMKDQSNFDHQNEDINTNYDNWYQNPQYNSEPNFNTYQHQDQTQYSNQDQTQYSNQYQNQDSCQYQDSNMSVNHFGGENQMHSSSSYSYVYKENPKNARVPMNEDQRLFDEQTMEYNKCCEEAFQKEMENNLSKHYEENQQQIEQEEYNRKVGEVVSKYYSLKPEPQNGTTVAIFMHNERLMRKFDPNDLGESVYAWVAGQTIDDPDDEKLFFDNFQLQVPGHGNLLPHQTLADQGIKGRVMMNIVTND